MADPNDIPEQDGDPTPSELEALQRVVGDALRKEKNPLLEGLTDKLDRMQAALKPSSEVHAAGGGMFMTQGPTQLTVGDNPGGMELVHVTPISGKGSTTVEGPLAGHSKAKMAGGGSLLSGIPSWLSNLFGAGKGSQGMLDRGERTAEVGRKMRDAGRHPGRGMMIEAQGRAQYAGGSLAQAANPATSELGSLGNVSQAIGALGGMIPVIGPVVAGLGTLGKVVLDSIDTIQRWNHALLDANFKFAEFSGSMAAVQAQRTVRQIQLSRERGERRADSTQYLAQQSDRLDAALAPIQDLVGNIKNGLFGFIAEKLAGIFEGINGILAFFGVLSDTGTPTTVWNQGEWLAEIGRTAGWGGDFGDPRGLPPAGGRR